MSLRLPELNINIEASGFYKGFNKAVSLISLSLVVLIVAWIALDPKRAGDVLLAMQAWTLRHFNYFYTYAVVFYIAVCAVIALWPRYGKIKLGRGDDQPEFSNFSWFAMMFGAGIGIGVLSYAAAEPIWHLANNPEILISKERILTALAAGGIVVPDGGDVFALYQQYSAQGRVPVLDNIVTPNSREAVPAVFRYSYFHWGISAWACYAMVGVSLAFFSYSRGLPLTFRSTLLPLFGKSLQGGLGNMFDITAVIATMLGIALTIGIGLGSFASGLYNITGATWVMTSGASPEPTISALLICLIVIMAASMLSALSGVGRGIKWLSNLNMVLSLILICFFMVFGATAFIFKTLLGSTVDYLLTLPVTALQVWNSDTELGAWQGDWSIYYWAWWIAFAPFVGVFLARISKNRTVREFVFSAILAPSFLCFVWFTCIGGTGIDLELSGAANGEIIGASLTYQIYQIINFLLSGKYALMMSALVVVLLLTYLVTSADSAILVVNTISAGGATNPEALGNTQLVVWGLALTAIIAALQIAGGLDAIQAVMIVGTIPFSITMLLMGACLIKALFDHSNASNSAANE